MYIQSNIVTNYQNKASVMHNMGLVLIFILALTTVFPPIRALPKFNLFWAFLMIFWYLVTIVESPKFIFSSSKVNYLIIFFILYTVILSYLTGNTKIGNRFFEISQVFLFYLAYKKNNFLGRPTDNLLIIKGVIPFVLLSSLATLYAYQFNPIISRALKAGSEIGNEALVRGIGGYELIYFLVIISPVLLSLILSNKFLLRRKTRIFLIAIYGIFSINIILSNYSTALLLFLIGTIIILFMKKISFLTILLNGTLILIIMVAGSNIFAYFFDQLSNLLGKSMNATRMAELSQLASNNIEGQSIGARLYTYERSIDAFFQSPIFGIINKNLNITAGLTGFGQHSQILDCFALFGLFIGLLQLYLFIKPFISKIFIKIFILKKLTFTVLLLFITLVTINNITTSIGFAAFFIFPTVYDWYKANVVFQHIQSQINKNV